MAQSWERANALNGNACGLGHAVGCLGLGNNYLGGSGVPKDRSKAASLHKRARGLGLKGACSLLK